jgi:hypothetical protein
VSRKRWLAETNLSVLSTGLFLILILQPWRWRRYIPYNVRLSSNSWRYNLSPLSEPQTQLIIYNWWMRSLTYVTSVSRSQWGKSRCPHQRETWTWETQPSARLCCLTYGVSNSLCRDITLRNTCRHCNVVILWRMQFSCHKDKWQGCPIYSFVVNNYSPQFSIGSRTCLTGLSAVYLKRGAILFKCFWVLRMGHAVALWLKHYAKSRKVAGSKPDEVNEFFFSICLILPAALGPGVYSASNRNEYQKQKNNVSGEYSEAGA